jgi:peroxiredoxin
METSMFRKALSKVLLFCLLPMAITAEASPLTDLEGNPRSISDYTGNGQWTVVMIWAAGCGICQREAPKFETFHRKYKDDDARVLGLSVDGAAGVADAREFVTDHGLSFVNLLGENEDVAALFYDNTGEHLVGTPGFLVFGPDGQLRTYQVGVIEVSLIERFMQQFRLASAEG